MRYCITSDLALICKSYRLEWNNRKKNLAFTLPAVFNQFVRVGVSYLIALCNLAHHVLKTESRNNNVSENIIIEPKLKDVDDSILALEYFCFYCVPLMIMSIKLCKFNTRFYYICKSCWHRDGTLRKYSLVKVPYCALKQNTA